MRWMLVLALLLSIVATASAQRFEQNATSCIETAELGLWSPWVEYDDSEYRGQWFRADGPLGGKCSAGGKFFIEGSVIDSGTTLDLRVLGVGNHFLTAKLKPLESGMPSIRKVWQVQITEPGDIDGDGAVTFADFLSLARDYGATKGRQHGDLDYNGQIGFTDFMILSRNFGHVSGKTPIATPEPSGSLLGWLAVVSLLLLRSKRDR